MTKRFSVPKAFLFTAVSLGFVIGCGKSAPEKTAGQDREAKGRVHDHGDGTGPHSHGDDPHDVVITEAEVERPADFEGAVARIKSYREAIERASAGEIPGRAHGPLDRLDIVLRWLPGIARESNVPKSQWETINTTAQELRELFEKVHQNIDNKKDPDFPAVKEAVDEAIGRLAAAASAPAAEE